MKVQAFLIEFEFLKILIELRLRSVQRTNLNAHYLVKMVTTKKLK